MSIKVCLINVSWKKSIRADYSDVIEKGIGFYQPLGLQYLSSACRDKNYETMIIDCDPEELNYEQVISKMKLYGPQVIGITCMTFNLFEVFVFLKELKLSFPNIPVVVGGPHASIFPKETLQIPSVDVVVVGEGEEVFPEIIHRLTDNISLNGLKGVSYKKENKLYLNSEVAVVQDLNSLSFPDRISLSIDNYFTPISQSGKSAIMMTSRGCPYNCIYCDRPAMGKKFRARTPQNVITEIKDCLKVGAEDIMFFDDTFTVDRNRVIEICELINKEKLKFRWSARARVNTVDKDLLLAMKEAGCCRISYGIESGNVQTLKILRKGISLDQAKKAVKAAKKVGMEVLADFILGCPNENRQDVLNTINFAISLNPDYAQFTILSLYPGTEVYQMALEQKIIKSDVWKEFAMNPKLNFNTPIWSVELSQKELEELLIFAYKKFYRRLRYIIKRILKIGSFSELILKAKVGFRILTMGKAK